MASEAYQEIYGFLRYFPLSLSTEEGVIFLQSENETLGIEPNEEDKFKIVYLALDRRITYKTLEGCPGSVRDWFEELHNLKDDTKGYVAVAYFESIFDFDTALEVCGFMGSRMAANEKTLEGIVVN